MQFILTFAPTFRRQAAAELAAAVPDIKFTKHFSEAVALAATEHSKADFTRCLLDAEPIFVRHCMPVDGVAELNGADDTRAAVRGLCAGICGGAVGAGTRFSVQCRIISDGDTDLSAKDYEVAVGSWFESAGAVPVFSDTGLLREEIQIVSIFIYHSRAYAGLSGAAENLNFQADEYRVLSRSGRIISRAEHKLREAIVKFGLELPPAGGEVWAMDIGAAPGGWSNVLLEYGYHVTAVDPARLDPRLAEHPRLEHARCRIERFEPKHAYALIVCDMNVGPAQAARMMVTLRPLLAAGGLAVLTLKLPVSDAERDIAAAREILGEAYEVRHIKNLCHNRREVTAVLRAK